MRRIIASVRIENANDREKRIRCDALVDTGAAHLILPTAWRDRLGELEEVRTIDLETATQATIKGKVFAPVRIQIEGFPPVVGEVLFLDMIPDDGEYEPLIGYVILELSQAAVDMVGHRLVHVKRMDLK